MQRRQDIAVLKLIDGPKQIVPIKKASSKTLRVGRKAVAIGNPFGLDHTMTTGIVSAILIAKLKGLQEFAFMGLFKRMRPLTLEIQGAHFLIPMGGLIGMNTSIVSGTGFSSGLGFAIPSDMISRVVPQLIEHGRVIRPALGVQLVPDEISKGRLNIEEGVVIGHVFSTGPAANAKLTGLSQAADGSIIMGDIILSIDGKETNLR